MKRLIKEFLAVNRWMDGWAAELAFVLTIIMAWLSYLYMRGEVVLTDGKVMLDLTPLISGYVAWAWMAAVGLWGSAKIVLGAVKARNWWAHREEHKTKGKRQVLLAWRKLIGDS